MKLLHLLAISLILFGGYGCKDNVTSIVPINPDNLIGKWRLSEFEAPIPCPSTGIIIDDSVTYDFENNQYRYSVIEDTLVIENIGWGKQAFKIIELSSDSLILQQIRQQIYAYGLDETLINYPLEKYIRE